MKIFTSVTLTTAILIALPLAVYGQHSDIGGGSQGSPGPSYEQYSEDNPELKKIGIVAHRCNQKHRSIDKHTARCAELTRKNVYCVAETLGLEGCQSNKPIGCASANQYPKKKECQRALEKCGFKWEEQCPSKNLPGSIAVWYKTTTTAGSKHGHIAFIGTKENEEYYVANHQDLKMNYQGFINSGATPRNSGCFVPSDELVAKAKQKNINDGLSKSDVKSAMRSK